MAPYFLLLSPLFWALDIVVNREALLAGYAPLCYSAVRHLAITAVCLPLALRSGGLNRGSVIRRGCQMGALFGCGAWLVGWTFAATSGSHCGLITPLSFLFILLWRERAEFGRQLALPLALVSGGALLSSWGGAWQAGDLGIPLLALLTAAHTQLVERRSPDEPASALIVWQSIAAVLVIGALRLMTGEEGAAPATAAALLPICGAAAMALATAVEIRWQSHVGARAATLIYGLDAPLVAVIYLIFFAERLRLFDGAGLIMVFAGSCLAATVAARGRSAP